MKKSTAKLILFLRKNAVYCILAFCILAVGLSVTLMMVNRPEGNGGLINNEMNLPDDSLNVENPEEPDKPDQPVVSVISFVMPVQNPIEIGEYCETVSFNQTLGVYEAHRAVDFFAEEGSAVYAVMDGMVESVDNSILNGVTICINHGNGLKTYYNSLMDADAVVVNQKISAGDVIGEVSSTNRQEYKSGAHLHFSVTEDGVTVDPAKYLNFEEK